MKYRYWFLAAIAAMVIAVTSSEPVTAKNDLRVYFGVGNNSDACAWMTAYWSYKSEAHWRIVGGGARPKWVAPNGSTLNGMEYFNHPSLTPQMRFLAEVRPSKSCNGSGGTKIWWKGDFGKSGPKQADADWIHHITITLVGSKSTGYSFNVVSRRP